MHALIIGVPRSRTSFLSSAFQTYYKMQNLHEHFDSSFYDHGIKNRMLDKSVNLDKIYKLKEENLKFKTESVFSYQKAVTKLFPRFMIVHSTRNFFNSLDKFDYKILNNISGIFQFDRYNQILMLERNLVDSAISYIYAKKIGYILYPKTFSGISQVKEIYSNIRIGEELFPKLNYYILEYLIYQDLKKFIFKSYPAIQLNYDESIDFVKKNFNNLEENFYTDPKFEYSKIITNYNEIVDYINDTLESYSKIYKNPDFT